MPFSSSASASAHFFCARSSSASVVWVAASSGESSTARRAALRASSAASSRTSHCASGSTRPTRSEEHTSELQSRLHLVCRLLLEKKKKNTYSLQQLIPPSDFIPTTHYPLALHLLSCSTLNCICMVSSLY